MSSVSPSILAAAAAERLTQSHTTSEVSAAQLAAEHDRRQHFRRLVDPGITRPNSKEQAMASLKTLSTIAENLLREPDNPKFKQFKPTNTIIKRNLINPKGALEYAIELGFRPEVVNFQPYYAFHPRHMADLKIGAQILQEVLSLEAEKQERISRGKQEEKAVAAAATQKVKLAYMEDRKTKELNDQREKEARTARAAARRSAGELPRPDTPESEMPGSGYVLGMSTSESRNTKEKDG